ncbi:MAG: prepilin-type N-terminal cleavage/methylation domain-containing protein [Planctomycetales bacterium]
MQPSQRCEPFPQTTPRRDGFSLVEALVAVAVTSIAGAALLSSISAAVLSSTSAAHRAVARGLADQLMDEIAAARFPAATNPAPSGSTRENFDDIDDYAGLSERPPRTRDGQVLGSEGGELGGYPIDRVALLQPDAAFVARFAREVTVERVQPAGSGSWQVVTQYTDYRRVTVRVSHIDARGNRGRMAEVTRMFTNVPVAP